MIPNASKAFRLLPLHILAFFCVVFLVGCSLGETPEQATPAATNGGDTSTEADTNTGGDTDAEELLHHQLCLDKCAREDKCNGDFESSSCNSECLAEEIPYLKCEAGLRTAIEGHIAGIEEAIAEEEVILADAIENSQPVLRLRTIKKIEDLKDGVKALKEGVCESFDMTSAECSQVVDDCSYHCKFTKDECNNIAPEDIKEGLDAICLPFCVLSSVIEDRKDSLECAKEVAENFDLILAGEKHTYESIQGCLGLYAHINSEDTICTSDPCNDLCRTIQSSCEGHDAILDEYQLLNTNGSITDNILGCLDICNESLSWQGQNEIPLDIAINPMRSIENGGTNSIECRQLQPIIALINGTTDTRFCNYLGLDGGGVCTASEGLDIDGDGLTGFEDPCPHIANSQGGTACIEEPCSSFSAFCEGETATSCTFLGSKLNCGSCGNKCSDGETCVIYENGDAGCASGCDEAEGPGCVGSAECCDNKCINTESNSSYCGGCNIECNATEICLDGECSSMCAGSEMVFCGSGCVNINTNKNHCGNCDITCPSEGICDAGTCKCPLGMGYCTTSTECVDFNTDQNCGDCGNICLGNRYCDEGVCACPAGQVCT